MASSAMAKPVDVSHEYPTVTEYVGGEMEVEGELFPQVDTSVPHLFCAPARMFQVHPEKGRGQMIASDTLWLYSPLATKGTEQVTIIAQCGHLRFYMKKTDKCMKIANNEYMCLLPKDCIGLELIDMSEEIHKQLDDILRARVMLTEELDSESVLRASEFGEDDQENLYPSDATSQKISEMTGWLCNKITQASAAAGQMVQSYGERKTAEIEENKGDISASYIKGAENVRFVAEKANGIVSKLSDRVSRRVGSVAVKHVQVKEGDSKMVAQMRQLALSTMLAYSEVSDTLVEGYSLLLGSAKEQSQDYVEKMYGENAKKVVGDSAAAAVSTGHVFLTTRRMISLKSIIKSNAQHLAKQKVSQFANRGKDDRKEPEEAKV